MNAASTGEAKELVRPTDDAKSIQLSLRLRIVLSLVLAFHVTAVFFGPFAMGPQRSALATALEPMLGGYTQAASLDNGYQFFAPEPGPSHLVLYELTYADGRTEEGKFPNLEEHFPRLLYHRYFMLSEFLNTLDSQVVEVPDDELAELGVEGIPPPSSPYDLALRRRRDALIHNYARQLLIYHDAQSVKLILQRHLIPLQQDVLNGRPLDDPSLYQERELGVFDREEAS